MEAQIIAHARKIAQREFIAFPDYNEDEDLSLTDALTIITFNSMYGEEVESSEIYDFLNETINK